MVKWSLRVVILAALVVVGRELHLRQTEVTAVAGVIEQQRDAIARAELAIEDLDREIGGVEDQIRLLDARIVAIERRHPRGIPPSERGGYERLVAERNALARRQRGLVDRRGHQIGAYGRTVASHNARVDEATRLARGGTPTAVVRDLWNRLLGTD